MKDWTGNNKAPFACKGASNHSEQEREQHDFYATDPRAVEMLLELEEFNGPIWEPACGNGHMSKVLEGHDYLVRSSDIVKRDYFWCYEKDFLNCNDVWDGDIITNPPYKYAKEFVEKALEVVTDGHKVAMFLKLTFLESKKRRELFDKYPPKIIYVASSRLQCARNGDFGKYKNGVGMAVAYAWFVWEKGFKSEPIVRWFN